MAFTLTHKTVFGSNDDLAQYQTAAVTFTPGAKAIVVVFNPGAPTPSISGMAQVGSQQNVDTSRRLTIFESNTTPANGPITVNFSAPVETCNIWVGEVPDTYASPLVRQVSPGVVWQGNTSPAVAFTTAPLTSSAVFVAVVSNSLNDFTFASPFVGQPAGTTGTPPMRSEVGIATSGAPSSTVVTASGGTSIPHGALMVELRKATDPPVARIVPATQSDAAGGSFEWDGRTSTGNTLSYAWSITSAGTTGATTAMLTGRLTAQPSLADVAALSPGTGIITLVVTDATGLAASTTAEFIVVNQEATLTFESWNATSQTWTPMGETPLWDGATWEGDAPSTPVAPTILYPTSATALSFPTGETRTIEVTASGTNPKTYQWYKDASLIGGATSRSLVISSAGAYTGVVANVAGNATSPPFNATTTTAGAVATTTGSTSPLVLTGLEDTKVYDVSVQASPGGELVGSGSFTYFAAAPPMPTGVIVLPGDKTLEVHWSAPPTGVVQVIAETVPSTSPLPATTFAISPNGTVQFPAVSGATSYTAIARLPVIPDPVTTTLRLDVGGSGGMFDENGNEADTGTVSWEPDADRVTGVAFTTTDPGQLANLSAIYTTHRYGVNGLQTVSIPVGGTATKARVELKMVEPTFGAVSRRVFSIAGPNGTLVKDLDIFAAVGRGAVHTIDLIVPAVGGKVTLDLFASIDNPILAAVRLSDAGALPLTPVIAQDNPPAPLTIVYRTSSGTAPLDGVMLSSQSATIQLAPDATIAGPVSWHIDEVVDASPAFTAAASPWAANVGNPINFTAGSHTVRAVVPLTGGGSTTLTATFQAPSTSTGGGGTGVVTDATGVQASPAERVARIAGINGHFEYGTYVNDTAIADKYLDIGFRHHRFHPETGNSSIVGYLGQRGCKGWATVGHSSHGTPTAVVDYLNARKQVLRDNKQYLEGLLGPNEVDNSSTRGTTDNMRQTMQALWNAVQGDATIADLPLTSISMTWPTKSNVQGLGDMSAYVDGGDFHPYPGGYRGDDERRFPGELAAMKAILDAGVFPTATEWDYITGNDKYLLTSETGWHNNITQVHGHRGVPRDVAGVYGPALCVFYDQAGIARLHFYEAINQSSTGETESGIQNAFGIMDKSLNYKPLAYALKNYIAIFSDPGPAFIPGKLNYTLTGPSDLKHWVYQKRDGTFLVALYRNYNIWHETNQTYTGLEQADTTATFKLLSRNATVRTLVPYYRGGPNTTTATTAAALAANTNYTVSRVNAHLTIIEVKP